MKTAIRLLGIAIIFGLLSCSGPRMETKSETSRRTYEKIPGLRVSGARTEANVTSNMTPLLRKMQEIYREHRRNKPNLNGRLDIHFTVDCTGEIELLEITHSTVSDKEFEQAVMRPFHFADFDGWGGPHDETEIWCRVEFGDVGSG